MWTPSADIIDTVEMKQARQEEQRRAAFKDLSSRQFWLAALELDVTKASLLEYANATYSGRDLEEMTILISESATFSRFNPVVEELAEIKGIPANQLDTLWSWAETI